MNDIRELLKNDALGENSIPAIEVGTYLRFWDKTTFLVREKNGNAVQEFIPVKSSEFLDLQISFAAGLLDLGVEKGDAVAVFSPNSLRHAAAIYAILSIGAVFVPIYPTMTEEEAEDLVRHSESRIMIAGDVPQYQKSLAILNRTKSPLRRLIVAYQPETKEKNVVSFDDIVKTGRHSGRAAEVIKGIRNISGDDVAALIYTPGTTGVPKGALLTHSNFLAQRTVIDLFQISHKDVRLAHLPFSHVFGLSADLFSSGATGALLAIVKSFETEEVIDFIREVRPTVICSVPRMYEKICVNTLQTINHLKGFKRILYTVAVTISRDCFIRESRGKSVHIFLRVPRLMLAPILRRIRRSLHLNRCRLLVSGGGPLPLEVSYFFGGIRRAIVEGYGLTETAPIINVNLPGKNKPGTVGPPIDGVTERISDEGEILIKGPSVCKGYFNAPEENALAFTSDGFFRSGDLGRFDDEGYLMITGRLKDLIITSSGKNIAPLNIEKRFENDPMISYFCVVGDRKKYLTALVVPNFQMLRKHARDLNIKFTEDSDLVKHPDIIAFYKKRIGDICDSMARYEQIKKFTLLPHEFSVQSGEISPTFKFRRLYVQEKYKDLIDLMYPSSDSLPEEI